MENGFGGIEPTIEEPMASSSQRSEGDLWGITTYFNPVQYTNKPNLLKCFSDAIRQQGLKLMVVEMAFNDEPFVFSPSVADKLVQVRSSCVLWQKERLLNIGLKHLPVTCGKVVWVDADLRFGNERWVSETAELLEKFNIVQPYNIACWLPPNIQALPPYPSANQFQEIRHGIAYVQNQPFKRGIDPGHWGFAWAARREILDTHGLYDRFIVGGGDLAMAWGMYSHIPGIDRDQWLERLCSKAQIADFMEWREAICKTWNSNISFTNGPIYHWWHGSSSDRNYALRHLMLKEADFDPRSDIAIDNSGCWAWNSHKPELHRKVRDYFCARNEGERKLIEI